MNAKLLSLMLAAVICVGCSASNRETARKTVDPNSLYARIGGLNGMARAVDAMVNHVLGDTVILANKQLQMRAKPENVPGLKVRVVNVVDLMCLFPSAVHPHGMDEPSFVQVFTREKPVVFAFHGYQRAIHAIVHGQPGAERFHVRGFNEEGTTTTPFDMVVRNGMSRYHLCLETLRRASRRPRGAAELTEECDRMLARHERHIREHLEDMPEVRDWVWTEA